MGSKVHFYPQLLQLADELFVGEKVNVMGYGAPAQGGAQEAV